MKLYKITIKLLSPICTPLKGDTLWGHFVWGIANHEGDAKTAEFLAASRTAEPPLVVSSAFPSGMICKPLPEPEPREYKPILSRENYAEIKRRKKIKYCSAADFITGAPDPNPHRFEFANISAMHNTINRFSNTVTDNGLFATEEMWAKGCDGFDIYLVSAYEPKRIRTLCEWAFENGYGADASVGKGNIKITDGPTEVNALKSGTKYTALGPFVLNDFSAAGNLRADIFVRTGKIGGAFVSELAPWKKTVILYDEGAVFTADRPLMFIGNLLTDVHYDGRICQSGFAPVIPVE